MPFLIFRPSYRPELEFELEPIIIVLGYRESIDFRIAVLEKLDYFVPKREEKTEWLE